MSTQAAAKKTDAIAPFDILNERINHRIVGGSRDSIPQDVPEKFISRKGPRPMSAATVGLRDAREFESYTRYLYEWAVRDKFTTEDCAELIQPVADYCDTQELDDEGATNLRNLFIFTRAYQEPKATSPEAKDSIFFGLHEYAKRADAFYASTTKGFIFTMNNLDIVNNDAMDIDVRTDALEKVHAYGDERDKQIEQHYATLGEKYASRYVQKLNGQS